MGLFFKKTGAGAEQPEADDDETDDEFEERVYSALMAIARQSSAKLRSQLGSCVLLGTKYDQAPGQVREAIRAFIDEAEL